MTVTLVHSEPYWHSLRVHIDTYTQIAKGSEWTMRGSRLDTVATAYLTLENVPDLSGPILYSTEGYSTFTFNKNNRPLLLYQEPADFYVKLQTDTGQYFKYLPNYLAFGNFSIDLTTTHPTQHNRISLPMTVENYEAQLFGYKANELNTTVPLQIDFILSNGLPTDSIQLNYPPDIYAEYQTKIMVQETYLSDVSWYQFTERVVPTEFVKVDAAITSMQTGPNELMLETSGVYDMVTASWQFVDHSLMHYEWKVYAPIATNTIQLPEITTETQSMFPSLHHDSLVFQFTELTDFQTTGSYSEILNAVFQTSKPSRLERLDAVSVRKTILPFGRKK